MTAAIAAEPKPFYLSKTLWTNIIMFVGAALNQAFPTVAITPEVTAGIFAIVNLILRGVTKGAVTVS